MTETEQILVRNRTLCKAAYAVLGEMLPGKRASTWGINAEEKGKLLNQIEGLIDRMDRIIEAFYKREESIK